MLGSLNNNLGLSTNNGNNFGLGNSMGTNGLISGLGLSSNTNGNLMGLNNTNTI